jgi:4-diphosphocytidyl-2C-methyl-D-erythritol kinase
MSGSGATVFGLFAEESAAKKASEELRRSHEKDRVWVRVANTLASR